MKEIKKNFKKWKDKSSSWTGRFNKVKMSVFLKLKYKGFPSISSGKESACNMGDLGSIPGLGRSPGGGHGNSVCLPGESPWTESLANYSPWGHKKLDTNE